MKTAKQTKPKVRTVGFGLAALVITCMSSPALAQGTLFVTGDQVGVGTDMPDEKLHVLDGDLKVEQSVAGVHAIIKFATAASFWEIKQNGDTGRLTFFSPGGGATTSPFKFDRQATENLFRVGILGASTVDINGELIITGNCTEQDGACADYVFEPDYELRSLDELDAFIAENRHLPNVPSADEMNQHGVSMTHLSGRLLEKIEELVLYTLEQQNTIDQQDNSIKKLEARIEKIESDG